MKFESREKEALLKKLEKNIEKLLQELLPKLMESSAYCYFSEDYNSLVSAMSGKNYHSMVESLEYIYSWILDPCNSEDENSLMNEVTNVKVLIKIFLDPEVMEPKELKEIVSN